MVYTVARRILASAASAEDVLQETFVEVLQKAGSFRGESEFGFWIRRIAVNKCLQYLRSGWSSRRVDVDLSDQPDPRSVGAMVETQLVLESALAELSEMARAVVWLHDVEGYTHKEIGQMMGRTPSFSKSRLARAHERLRVLLEDEFTENGIIVCEPVLKTC
jgi:RNA polymerase sigma-70 factor (ECF subfamily)